MQVHFDTCLLNMFNVSFISFFGFWSFSVTQKYYVIFIYILQGKMGKTEKTERKSRKYSDQHTQNQKMKIWDEGNIKKSLSIHYQTSKQRCLYFRFTLCNKIGITSVTCCHLNQRKLYNKDIPYLQIIIKVHIFWEGHIILRNLPLTFDCMYCSQK